MVKPNNTTKTEEDAFCNIFSYGFKNTQNYSQKELNHIARVVKEDKNNYTLATHTMGFIKARLKGALYKTATVHEKACVGDFVFFAKAEESDDYVITSIVPRKNVITRVKKHKLQSIASNVDYAFIIMSLDEQFSVPRLERFLLLLQEQHINVVIVLNKKDLVKNSEFYVEQIKSLYSEVEVYLTSIYDESSLLALKKYLNNNNTILMIGVSGVGKSSLINIFAGEEIQQVQEVSELLSKGKHTTVARSIVKTKEGFLFIDIPGIKEISGSLQEEDIETLENEIINKVQEYARFCKFRNCSHIKEPSCAVLKAVEDGNLSNDVLKHYRNIKSIITNS